MDRGRQLRPVRKQQKPVEGRMPKPECMNRIIGWMKPDGMGSHPRKVLIKYQNQYLKIYSTDFIECYLFR